MGKSRHKLFGSAVIAGIALVLGLPGLADLISLVWETSRPPLEQIAPPELASILSLVSLAVFFTLIYLNAEIFLKGAKKGRKGLETVITGMVFGAVIGFFILSLASTMLR
jgi:RsiW-degrading membrane proteinase PrsW (M82 family)